MIFTTAYAQQAMPGTVAAANFVARFNDAILFPVIVLLTGIALLYFIYGCFMYIVHADDAHEREAGRQHIIYSIIGMFVMLAAYAILTIAANTFGLVDELDCADNPAAAGCKTTLTPTRP